MREVVAEAYIEHPKYGECLVSVEGFYSPGDPGNLHGSPENCWPSEPPEVEVGDIQIKECYDNDGKLVGEKVDIGTLSKSDRERVEQAIEDRANEDMESEEEDAAVDRYESRMEDREYWARRGDND